MEINTIIDGLEKLETASLYRTPKNPRELVDSWFNQFSHMPEDQFLSAVGEIIKLETVWPAIAIIYRYASNWKNDGHKKSKCPYCEDDGFLLIKTKGIDIAYACKCSVGKLRQANLKIASYESLGIPWPEIDKPARRSDKMTADNRKRIDGFLGRIGEEIPGGGRLNDEEITRHDTKRTMA